MAITGIAPALSATRPQKVQPKNPVTVLMAVINANVLGATLSSSKVKTAANGPVHDIQKFIHAEKRMK